MPRAFRFARPALLAVAVLAGGAASAQSMWRPVPEGPSVSLDVVRPFDSGDGVITNERGVEVGRFEQSPLYSAQILTVRLPVRSRVVVVGDLPMAYSNYGLGADTSVEVPDELLESDFAVGNPYVGVEVSARRDVTVEAGVRLPLSPSDADFSEAQFVGVVSLFETIEMYQGETFSARLGVRYEPALIGPVRLRLRLAPTLRTYPDLEFGDDGSLETRSTVFDLQYGAQVVAIAGPAELLGGVVGRVDGPGGGDFNPALLTLGATARGLPVRPGVLVRVPLADYVFSSGSIIGVSLDVPLR